MNRINLRPTGTITTVEATPPVQPLAVAPIAAPLAAPMAAPRPVAVRQVVSAPAPTVRVRRQTRPIEVANPAPSPQPISEPSL